jgi:hypothetical protein
MEIFCVHKIFADMNEHSMQYVWVDCRTAGWQVLMAADSVSDGVPVPPSCVTDKEEDSAAKASASPRSPNIKSKSPVKSSRLPGRPFSPMNQNSSAGPDEYNVKSGSPRGLDTNIDWEKSLNQYAPYPRPTVSGRDIVEENQRLDRPTRQTKVSLLEEASRQLQESEKVGTNLAERLAKLKLELKPS